MSYLRYVHVPAQMHTYIKTSLPHPAIAVKALGPKSLAGLIA